MEERNRIARELHNALTQKLFSLRLTTEAAASLVRRDAARAAEQLATVRRLAAEATEELRSIVVGLRPPALAGDGLDVALRKQAELLDRVHDARVRFIGDPVPRLTEVGEEAAYRIAQEALHNALRHADPTQVDVGLTCRDGAVVLEVTDDGNGFDTGRSAQSARRFGLISMRERARAAGGNLVVTSRPGGGTAVRLEVPTGG